MNYHKSIPSSKPYPESLFQDVICFEVPEPHTPFHYPTEVGDGICCPTAWRSEKYHYATVVKVVHLQLEVFARLAAALDRAAALEDME